MLLLQITYLFWKNFSIYWNMCEIFSHKSYIRSILQIVQNLITWLLYDWSNLYILLLQIKSVAHHLWNPFCWLGWYRYMYRPSSSSTFSSGYVLSYLAISSLIASFGFIPNKNNFVFLIVSTMVPGFSTQIVIRFQDPEALMHAYASIHILLTIY